MIEAISILGEGALLYHPMVISGIVCLTTALFMFAFIGLYVYFNK
jgi:hypothetical protein